MLPYKSFISWNLGPVTIQSFGLMMAIGFLAGTYLFARQFRGRQEREHAYNLAIIVITAGIVGSRILYFLENPGELRSVLAFFQFWEGGLSWFGGFLGALGGSLVYLRIKRLNFWAMADRISPSIAIGHAFGRIGCILGDGWHVGKLTSMPWGFNVNGEIRHVTAWYELVGLIILFAVLITLRKKRTCPGFVFSTYLLGYSVLRFVADFFRIDPTYAGLTVSQYFCIALFIAGSALMVASLRRLYRNSENRGVGRAKK